MKLLLTIIFSVTANWVLACTCLRPPDFKAKQDLDGYDVVAMVSIKKLAPYDKVNTTFNLRIDGKIEVEVLEHFKGDATTVFYDASLNTNCAMYMKEGEQWLLFGNKRDGKVYVDRCGYSVNYRDSLGGREWLFFTGIKQLDVLRTIYQHPLVTDMAEKQFYKNGKLELEQHFKNGKLDGPRKFYYPDGKIYITEEFKNGVRTGTRDWYAPSGSLRSRKVYKNGLQLRSATYLDTADVVRYLTFQMRNRDNPLFGDKEHDAAYFKRKLDSLRGSKDWAERPSIIFDYSADGRSYALRCYDQIGGIFSRGYLDRDKGMSEHYMYYKDGKLRSHQLYDQAKDMEAEWDYDRDGKRRDFVKKCEGCESRFGVNEPPAGAPEKIYIQ